MILIYFSEAIFRFAPSPPSEVNNNTGGTNILGTMCCAYFRIEWSVVMVQQVSMPALTGFALSVCLFHCINKLRTKSYS